MMLCSVIFLITYVTRVQQSDTQAQLTITMLNIGQGDAFYIRFIDGSDMLIDTGPDDAVLSELSEVMPLWDRTIDTLILTHPDSDHIGGAVAVLSEYNVSRVFDCGLRDKKTATVQTLYTAINAHAIPLEALASQDTMTFSSGEQIRVLAPDRSIEQSVDDTNACSLVFIITDGEATALFTGDTPIAVEEDLLEHDAGALDVDLLKVGHHGSNTSTSVDFLNAITPSVALISSGVRNRYHHPHPSVVSRLREHGVEIWNTAQDGRVRCVSTGEEFVCRED